MYLRFFFFFLFINGSVIFTNAQCTLSIDSTLSLQKNPSCFGGSNGSINVAVTGAKGAVAYSWSNGGTSATINNLAAGVYIIIVSDTAGCKDTGAFSLSEPLQLIATTSITNDTCNAYCEGTANVSASGGTSPYSYLWLNGNTSAFRNKLCAGSYSISVTDTNNCKTVYTISITEPSSLNVSITSTDTCIGGVKSGSASVTVTGETSPYIYNWSNGSTTASISTLSGGTYNVTVNDSKKCDTIIQTVVISEPPVVTVATKPVSSIPIYCAPGSADATVAGGTAPYKYSWNQNDSTSSISCPSTGSYTVTITDSKNCITTSPGVVNEKTCDIRPNPRVSFSPNDDNINDLWQIEYIQFFTKMKLIVFDRWGQKIHNQQGTYTEWDGKSFGIGVPDGVYYFILVPDTDHKDIETQTGSLTIIR